MARVHFSEDDQQSDNESTERVAQWIDEDEDDVDSDDEQRLRSLQDDLSTLPLGALRSAQRSLAHAHPLSDSEPDSDDSDDDDPPPAKDKDPPKTVIAKRTNKHAPVQVTSKRPVSRRRVVVADTLPKPRDPRFMHAAGRHDPMKFKQQYGFLADLRSDELSTLRQHVKRAQKLLVNSPAHLRAEREGEVRRLEHAVKRAESAVNLDNRQHIESTALQSAKQAEKEKRKQGKAGWWMKRAERKALLDKARMDAIVSAGGRQAVKKAIEKKQKKISQKEKKMRPFPRSEGKRQRPPGSVDTPAGGKRRRVV